MTAEEKAQELMEKFHQAMYSTHDPNATVVCYLHSAKPCALIAVNEIINEWSKGTSLDYVFEQNYWKQVKEEINKI